MGGCGVVGDGDGDGNDIKSMGSVADGQLAGEARGCKPGVAL